MKVTIPSYITIQHYLRLQHLTDIESTPDKVLYKISSILDIPMEELEKWPISAIKQVNDECDQLLDNIKPEFYPIIEWQGKFYGYRAVQKMSMAEYIDISELCKNPTQNLPNILALLYRPITKNKVNTSKYLIKSTIKALQYDVENVFDYYDIEEYDSVTRKQVAEEYKHFPAEIGLGALNFFMLVGLNSQENMKSYFPSMKQMMTITLKKKNKIKSALLSTIAGYISSTKWQKRKSYQLQETKQ